MRQKKRKRKKHKEQVGVAPSPSPHAPATPESKPLPLIPLDQTPAPSAAPETPILGEEAAATARRTKERKRKKRKVGHGQAAPSPPSPPAAAQTPVLEEEEEEEGEAVMVRRKKKKRNRWKHEEEGEEQMPSSPSPPTVAGIPLLEEEEETATRRKKWKRRRYKEKQEQVGTSPQAPAHPPSGQSPLPFYPGCSDQTHCVHLQGTPAPAPTPPPPEEEQEGADGPKGKGVKRSNGKKPRELSTREIIKMRMELRKQQQLPEGFLAAMTMTSNPNSDSNCIEQNTNHSSPFGTFFDQFCYKPVRQDRNPAHPRTPDRLARPPPRGHPSSEWSHLTANETSKAAKANTSIASKSKQPGSGSVSGSQEKVKVKERDKPEKKVRIKKLRKPPPLLPCAEKCSDKYRRLPLDQLVPPPRSPHKLLQEKYASDPWKVIVICMLLNVTQGKQVRKKVKGFFKRYPDAQTAFNADPEKMVKYLAPLGLQRVKANRIQKFSKAYVEKEWTYITELCGVGKYAADAYAIFCAGRATEVVPEDHKLVDYWKYVCFELPTIQRTQNVQEAVVTAGELSDPFRDESDLIETGVRNCKVISVGGRKTGGNRNHCGGCVRVLC